MPWWHVGPLIKRKKRKTRHALRANDGETIPFSRSDWPQDTFLPSLHHLSPLLEEEIKRKRCWRKEMMSLRAILSLSITTFPSFFFQWINHWWRRRMNDGKLFKRESHHFLTPGNYFFSFVFFSFLFHIIVLQDWKRKKRNKERRISCH